MDRSILMESFEMRPMFTGTFEYVVLRYSLSLKPSEDRATIFYKYFKNRCRNLYKYMNISKALENVWFWNDQFGLPHFLAV